VSKERRTLIVFLTASFSPQLPLKSGSYYCKKKKKRRKAAKISEKIVQKRI
jgi:hypothetical protein